MPKRLTLSYRIAAACVAAALSVSGTAPALGVSLVWDANSESHIAGYRVYYGTSTGALQVVDVGNTTRLPLSNLLKPGRTYYFAATAYNIFGVESALSAFITYTPSKPTVMWKKPKGSVFSNPGGPEAGTARNPLITTRRNVGVRGTTSVRSPARILYHIGRGSARKAVGNRRWKFTATLRHGRNKILIVVFDREGNRVTTEKMIIIRRKR